MISIIIPVYNVEKYLRKCIDSIINQTFSDWELILVNDGSIDNSGGICNEYASKDHRIRVIHKKNEGVSKARNIGIELAEGEYICFVDSDDWIDTTYLSDFGTHKHNCDFYFSGALYDTCDKVYSYKRYQNKHCKNTSEIRDEFFKQNLLSNGYPWGKLYRTSIIKDNLLKFNENLTINEDHIFVFQYFSYISSLYITNTAGYHYTVFDNSGRKLSGRINKYSELKSASEQFNIIIDNMKNKWQISLDDYNKLINSFVFSKRLSAFRSLILLKEKQFYYDELKYWKNISFKGNNKTEKIIIYIIQSNLVFCKFFLCYYFYKILKARSKRMYKKLIYNDLNYRSTKL